MVSFNISSTRYNYSIDAVMSNLVKDGLMNSTIRNQSIVLISYSGPKDAVEVRG